MTIVLVAALYYFLFKTGLGRMMRATAQDRDTARLIGINVSRVGTITFAMSLAAGGMAGVMVAPLFLVDLNVGFLAGLKAFIATIIGGWGSIPGALAGGLLVGLVEVFASHFFTAAFKDPVAFAVLMIFLIVRQAVFSLSASEIKREASQYVAVALCLSGVLTFARAVALYRINPDLWRDQHSAVPGLLRDLRADRHPVARPCRLHGDRRLYQRDPLDDAWLADPGLHRRGYADGGGHRRLARNSDTAAEEPLPGSRHDRFQRGGPPDDRHSQQVSPGAYKGLTVAMPSPVTWFGFTVDPSNQSVFLMICLVAIAIAVAGLTRLRQSRVGNSFEAVRDDELAASVIGINLTYTKILAFVISAALAGFGGALYAHFVGFVSPDHFTFDTMVLVLAMVVIGGKRSIAGVIVGTILLTALPEILRDLKDWYPTFYGVLLLLTLWLAPNGLVGGRNKSSFFRKSQAAVARYVGALSVMTLLAINNLTKRFGGITAVDALSINVEPGGVHGLIGPNGSGKSTILNLISGLYRPTSGSITMGGTEVTRLMPHERTRAWVLDGPSRISGSFRRSPFFRTSRSAGRRCNVARCSASWSTAISSVEK